MRIGSSYLPAGTAFATPGDFTVVLYVDRGTAARVNLNAGCL
jgi:hypothetical protein